MWKKKYKFKFVDFSHGTAKKNPDMIINEYKRIIEDLNYKIRDIRKDKHEISVLRSCVDFYLYNKRGYVPKEKITLSSIDIINLHNKIMKEESKELALLEHKDKVEDELEMFKSKYKTWRQ